MRLGANPMLRPGATPASMARVRERAFRAQVNESPEIRPHGLASVCL
jgi:hypothetical protein